MASFQYRAVTALPTNDVVMEDNGVKQKTFGEKANTRKALRPLNQGQQGLKGANLGKKTKANLLQPHVKHQVQTRTLRSSRMHLDAKQSSAVDIFLTEDDQGRDLMEQEVEDLEMEEEVSKATSNIINIDEGDEDCPQMCTEYVEEIMDYLHVLERQYVVRPDYMEGVQTDVHHRMRAILIDWLVEVHMKFKLLQETLYLTVTIIDRYLETVPVKRSKLQLVGCTAMLLASKYEEIYAPEVRDFIYISDNAYTPEEVLAMERHMLLTLQFRFSNPLPLHFLRRNSKAAGADSATHNTAKFIMELSLVDYTMLQFLPSQIAAAALFISMEINTFGDWDDTIAHYSKFTEESVRPVVHALREMMTRAKRHPKLQAVRNKYKSSRVGEVTQHADRWLKASKESMPVDA